MCMHYQTDPIEVRLKGECRLLDRKQDNIVVVYYIIQDLWYWPDLSPGMIHVL